MRIGSFVIRCVVAASLIFAMGCGSDTDSDEGNNGNNGPSELSCGSTCDYLLGLCPDLIQVGLDQAGCESVCADQMDQTMRECINDKSTCQQTESCGQIDLSGGNNNNGQPDAGTEDADPPSDTGTGQEDTGTSDDNACGWSTACLKLPTSTADAICGVAGTPAYSCCISDGTPPASAGCIEEERTNAGDATTVDYCCADDF